MKKKIVSGLIAICMAFSFAAAMPEGVFSESTSITVSAADTATFGKCGENISWSLDGKGVLTISGTGKMASYDWGESPFYNRKDIKSVVIKSGVTSIGDYAFSGCESLTSITIPSSVTSIGDGAFDGCSSLTSITIPSSVKSIEEYAFYGCKSLTSINIPSSVKSIGGGAFVGCASLTSITIPSSVTSIGDGAFAGCTSLKSVTIPSSVKSIEEYAFYGCKSLTSINIPSSVKSIGDCAFWDCTNLSSVTIQNGVKSIGDGAFGCCSSLKSVTIPNSVISIGHLAFEDCTSLTSVTIQNGVKSIGGSAFYNCKSLTSVTIPSSVTSIGGWAFGYNSDGSKITKIDGFTVYGKTGSAAEKYANENGFKFVTRLSGSSRYETAAKIADEVKAQGSVDRVFLVNAEKFADALAGVPLAVNQNAAILLAPNPKDSQHDTKFKSTLDEIKKLGAKNVIILGGNSSVSKEKAEDVLKKQGYTVTRIKGSTRYETATNIAEKVNSKPTEVFIVYSRKFPDALAISSIAAQKKAPILYVDKKGTIDKFTKAYLTKHKATIKKAYVIGGTGAISDDVKSQIDKTLGITSTRIKGSTRYETCLAVLNYSEFKSFVNGTELCVTTGEKFPDALAGGVLAAMTKSPVMLVNGKQSKFTLTDTQKTFLKSRNTTKITIFGGKSAVSDSHVQTVAAVSV